MRSFPYIIFFIIFFIFISFSGCHQSPKQYTTTLGINRMEIVRFDENKQPLTLDVEVVYPDCPGDQIEVLRGDAQFAKCILSNYKKGDKVEGKILWEWNTFGYYDWHIQQIGVCERILDPLDEASYDMIEECEDYVVYGAKVGFTCKRIATSKLIEKCPWFRKE